MNVTAWLSTLTVILGFLSVALGLLARWLVANKAEIVALIQAVRDIHNTVDPKNPQSCPNPLPAAIAPPAVTASDPPKP